MTSRASIQAIEAFWSSYLGCPVEALRTHTTTVVAPAPQQWHGVLLFRMGPACVISVPAALRECVDGVVGGRDPDEVFRVNALTAVLGADIARTIGPAWLGYADTMDFRPAPTLGTRLLGHHDERALHALAAACGAEAWEHSGVASGHHPVYGCFVEGALVAAGIAEPWGDRLLHLGIVTHPAHRGHGYGRAVVSAMSADGLAAGRVLQYRTLQSNHASLALARALGYREQAATIALRLADGAAR